MSEPAPKYRATVTRRPVVEPVDAAERQLQTKHHQTAVQAANAAATAAQAEPAVSKPRLDPHALQSAFLAGNLGKTITVFLTNSVRLSGKLAQFDQYCLLIESENQQQLIFKHVIAMIMATPR